MVKIAAVIDSACLIGLERVGGLDLLPALIDPVMVPPAVEAEFGPLPPWMVVQAKQAGVIPVIRPLLDALDANQFRIGEALRAEALRLAGE